MTTHACHPRQVDAEPRVAAAASLDAHAAGAPAARLEALEFTMHGDTVTDVIEGVTDAAHAAHTWSMLAVIGIEDDERSGLARAVLGVLR